MLRRSMEKHQTLRERILETIRDAIMTGALKPGEKVAEPELAERFGISRTPIREAFRQLESEGYLTVIPRKGAVVVSFTEKDVEEFYAIKGILEGHAARKACGKMGERDLERLVAVNDKLRRLAVDGDVKHYFKVHNDFHDIFLKAADNEMLYDLVTNLVNKFQRLRYASLRLPGRMRVSVEEHDKIIEAFRKRDADKAERLVRKNAEYGGKVLMDGGEGTPLLKGARKAAAMHVDI